MRPAPRDDAAAAGGAPSLWDGLMRRLRDFARGGESAGGLREALEGLADDGLEDGGAASLAPAQRALVLNAISFGQLRVGDVMLPRTEIEAVPAEAGLAEVVAALRVARRPRLVVYRETLDDVLGLVHVQDLLEFWGDGAAFSLEAVVRPALVVPASMRVTDLLLEMRETRSLLAVVVDEFGGTDGLVAVEDLVEELVGDLHERAAGAAPARLRHLGPGEAEADARIPLEELERDLGLVFLSEAERDEADTLAGLLVFLADRLPGPGEVIGHPPSGLRFEVTEGDPRRIKRVRISGLPAAPAPAGDRPAAGAAPGP